jgi:hypothetical protein
VSPGGPPDSRRADEANRTTIRPPHSGKDGEIAYDRLVPALKSPVSVPLGRLESTVFMRVDGRRSVLDIAQEVGLTPFEVLRILERLVELVPDLRLGESDVVELSVDDLWEDSSLSVIEAAPPTKVRE